MRAVTAQSHWADSWKLSFEYDRMEVHGEPVHRGYLYAYQNRRRVTLDLLGEVLAPPARVLDIAAAQGNFSLALAERGYEVTWNDLRAELADYVKLKHEHGDLRFAPGNAFELAFEEAFDAVLVTEVIEHVAHPDVFLRQVGALLRPGGFVILTTPNGAYFRNRLPRFSDCADPSMFESLQFRPDADGHIFLLHPNEIRAIADQAGLEIERFELFTNPLTNGHMKTEALLRVLPRPVVDVLERGSMRLPAVARERLMVQTGVRLKRPEPAPNL